MLIASDKYGGPGSDTRSMRTLAAAIREGIDHSRDEPEGHAVEILSGILRNVLLHHRRAATRIRRRIEALVEDLGEHLLTVSDYQVLALTCDNILVPVNDSLRAIPSDDSVFAESVAKALRQGRTRPGKGCQPVGQGWRPWLHGCGEN